MNKPKTVRLQVNADLSPMGSEGDVIEVPVSPQGTLKIKYWRRRLADAKTDKCVEILKDGDPGTRAKTAAKAGKADKAAKDKAEAEAKDKASK